jgi:hypothetical protein
MASLAAMIPMLAFASVTQIASEIFGHLPGRCESARDAYQTQCRAMQRMKEQASELDELTRKLSDENLSDTTQRIRAMQSSDTQMRDELALHRKMFVMSVLLEVLLLVPLVLAALLLVVFRSRRKHLA